ncbi:MAG: DUF2851 family protein [Marinilabiliales bacterium]|nr:DUF2851 family protein [Marinilabiliales bacterium]
MKEDFIQFIWKVRLFEPERLLSPEGEPIEVLFPGRHNHDAGPDFFDARIKIGQTLWAGNVEIHLKASDWNRHGHQQDPLYANTILHVVKERDALVRNCAGAIVPTVAIGWPLWIEHNYLELLAKHDWVNCVSALSKIDPFRIRFFLNGVAIERMQDKTVKLEHLLDQTGDDWQESFYRLLCAAMGFRLNGVPFEMLARSLPFSLLLRHRDNLFQLEALLFGQSGMLEELLPLEPYPAQLKAEYDFLSAKYGLKPMAGHLWKFMRMHPLNFPTLRIAQLASLIHHSGQLWPFMDSSHAAADYRTLFRKETSPFWDDHFTFVKASPVQKKRMGEESFRLLLINVVVPFLFLYGERMNQQTLKDHALKIMEELPPEDNSVIRHWTGAGIPSLNALDTQALLHLHNSYCGPGRCLECSIGQRIILHLHP